VTLRSRLTDLGPRVASGLVLVAGAILTLLSGGLIFLLAWLAAAFMVHLEWQRLIGGTRLVLRVGLGTLAIVGAGFLTRAGNVDLAVFVLGLGALASAYLAEEGRRVWSAAGIVYAGSLIISVAALRGSFPFGARAVGWLFAVVWGTDVMAYFAGRLIGGPKFAPQISPSKTWAGTLCGMIGGACLGTLFLIIIAHITRLETPAPLLVLFLLGLITSGVAQGGDLFESWAKRCFGAKDSGGMIPGHGGLMDRLDGFIAAAVWVAILGALRGFPSPAEGLFHWM
jgi:phosphatidate cytidylyltransferase